MKNKSTNRKKNDSKDSDEEMLQVAFDINEGLNLPDDYQIDDINKKSVEFLKFVKTQRKNLEIKNENFKQIELEFSLNVNNHLLYQDIYDKLKIDKIWVDIIKDEFNKLRNQLVKYKKDKNTSYFKNVGEIVKEHKLYLENLKYFSIPNEAILQDLCPKLSNKLCIKLINHFHKILSQTSQNTEVILVWIFYLLGTLEMPLVDEDNSILYSVNKNLVKSLSENKEEIPNIMTESIGKKMIFVIISEIFGQKIIKI
jgi:hypothetical protein